MIYNPEVHHRRTIRLKGYDYAQTGAYFVTICTHEGQCLFGEIDDGVMKLNDEGAEVQNVLVGLPEHYPSLNLDEFIVMPNHIHAILLLDCVGAQFIPPDFQGLPSTSGAINRAPTIGNVVRGFKARCAVAINKLRNSPGTPVWQRNYFERIIRNDQELSQAREYIANNPCKWHLDQDNPAVS